MGRFQVLPNSFRLEQHAQGVLLLDPGPRLLPFHDIRHQMPCLKHTCNFDPKSDRDESQQEKLTRNRNP